MDALIVRQRKQVGLDAAQEHFEMNTNAVQVANIASLCATAKTGSFNLRVVTMVADKLKRL